MLDHLERLPRPSAKSCGPPEIDATSCRRSIPGKRGSSGRRNLDPLAPRHGRPRWNAHGAGQQAPGTPGQTGNSRGCSAWIRRADSIGGTEATRSTCHPSYLAGHPDRMRPTPAPSADQHPRWNRLAVATASLTRPWPHERSADGASPSQPAKWLPSRVGDGVRRRASSPAEPFQPRHAGHGRGVSPEPGRSSVPRPGAAPAGRLPGR